MADRSQLADPPAEAVELMREIAHRVGRLVVLATPRVPAPPPSGITLAVTFTDPATGEECRVECATAAAAKAVTDAVIAQRAALGIPSGFVHKSPTP